MNLPKARYKLNVSRIEFEREREIKQMIRVLKFDKHYLKHINVRTSVVVFVIISEQCYLWPFGHPFEQKVNRIQITCDVFEFRIEFAKYLNFDLLNTQ